MLETQQNNNNNQIENSLQEVSNENLLERYNDLTKKYEKFVEDLQLFLSKFTNIRTELILVETELRKRGTIKDGII